MTQPQSGPPRPTLRVVRGNPTREELAAVVALLAARSASGATEKARAAPSLWNAKGPLLRRPLPHGEGAWRASAFRT